MFAYSKYNKYNPHTYDDKYVDYLFDCYAKLD